ncbi:MAG: hypothetical protein IPK07_17250 [Deltaproteobacteria bacterium]|nr:hypothetical protein [Deltaproteobacteria bacterium]
MAMQREQQQRALQRMNQELARNPRADAGFVGTWVATPQNRFLPGGFTFTLDGRGTYAFTPKSGAASRGRAQVMSGSVTMIDAASGEIRQGYYELSDSDTGVWTELDATQYDIRRQR